MRMTLVVLVGLSVTGCSTAMRERSASVAPGQYMNRERAEDLGCDWDAFQQEVDRYEALDPAGVEPSVGDDLCTLVAKVGVPNDGERGRVKTVHTAAGQPVQYWYYVSGQGRDRRRHLVVLEMNAHREREVSAVEWVTDTAAAITGVAAPAGGDALAPEPMLGEGARFVDSVTVDVLPVRLGCPTPAYPVTLRDAKIEGEVVVAFVVEVDGSVHPQTVTVRSATHPDFVRPSVQMVAHCLFRPGLVSGKPVRVLMNMPVMFHLSR